MKKGIIALVVAFVVVSGCFCAWFVLKVKSDYDALIAESQKALVIQIETERLNELRAEVKAGLWEVNTQSYDEFKEMLSVLGMKEGLEGIAEFYSYTLHTFDLNDLESSKKSVTIALARSVIDNEHDDGLFHLTEDGHFGVVFVGENVIEFHQDTERGTLSGLLTKRNSESNLSEQATAYAVPVF